jgi:hypothetical protein
MPPCGRHSRTPRELGFALTLVDGRKDLAVFATVVASVFAPVTA